jgi:hypothetical protein
MDKVARRLELLARAGEPNGTGTLCADCKTPRTILNTSVTWSNRAKTRLTFHYAVCDACRSAKLCKRLRHDPAAKLVQMGADAAARTKRAKYDGAPLAARECTDLVARLFVAQEGLCASCKHEVALAAGSGIYMASLDKVGARYDESAQVLCLGCQRLFNDLGEHDRAELTRAIVVASTAPRPRPVKSLPIEFERSVVTKVEQMHRHEVAMDRPSRGALVALSVPAACRRLQRSGLHCVCAEHNSHSSAPAPPLDRSHPLHRTLTGGDERAVERDSRGRLSVVLRPRSRRLGICRPHRPAGAASVQRRQVRVA